MKHYAIVINGSDVSESAYNRMQKSTSAKIDRFAAITPSDLKETLSIFDIQWNYPWGSEELDMMSGLIKKPYPTKNKDARIAAACSHYILWNMCVTLKEPIVILEHDAIFLNDIDFDPDDAPYDIIGLNDPRGATRLSMKYHQVVQNAGGRFTRAPKIDADNIPQGLAGNSAYIIKPSGAKHMMNLVKQYGMWPNDCLMCRQLVPKLGVTTKYYTKVQGTRSTTTL